LLPGGVAVDGEMPAAEMRMAGLIHLELLTDFFNKIGPNRTRGQNG
jgi:hypothetical protein